MHRRKPRRIRVWRVAVASVALVTGAMLLGALPEALARANDHVSGRIARAAAAIRTDTGGLPESGDLGDAAYLRLEWTFGGTEYLTAPLSGARFVREDDCRFTVMHQGRAMHGDACAST